MLIIDYFFAEKDATSPPSIVPYRGAAGASLAAPGTVVHRQSFTPTGPPSTGVVPGGGSLRIASTTNRKASAPERRVIPPQFKATSDSAELLKQKLVSQPPGEATIAEEGGEPDGGRSLAVGQPSSLHVSPSMPPMHMQQQSPNLDQPQQLQAFARASKTRSTFHGKEELRTSAQREQLFDQEQRSDEQRGAGQAGFLSRLSKLTKR